MQPKYQTIYHYLDPDVCLPKHMSVGNIFMISLPTVFFSLHHQLRVVESVSNVPVRGKMFSPVSTSESTSNEVTIMSLRTTGVRVIYSPYGHKVRPGFRRLVGIGALTM